MKSSSIRSTRGLIEVTLPPRPPRLQLRTPLNRINMVPSRDSIGSDPPDTTIIETDYDHEQKPMNVLLK